MIRILFLCVLLSVSHCQKATIDDHEDHHEHDHDHDHEDHTGHDHGPHDEPAGVKDELGLWLVSTGAILAISLCGVFGVLVIPIMQKVFYQHLIQFLVALAIGTLAGDALLHLYPHALLADLHQHGHEQAHGTGGGHEAEDFHQKSVWKGFCGMS